MANRRPRKRVSPSQLPRGMPTRVLNRRAVPVTRKDTATICIKAGSRVMINWIAWIKPLLISSMMTPPFVMRDSLIRRFADSLETPQLTGPDFQSQSLGSATHCQSLQAKFGRDLPQPDAWYAPLDSR